jgi:hypothetical protein
VLPLMRRLAWLACWACLLALLTARAAAATAQSSAPCVVADQQHQLSSGAPRTLEDCLADTAVSQVVIAGDHAVGSDFAKYAGAQEPLRLNRCACVASERLGCASRPRASAGAPGCCRSAANEL